MTKPALKVGLTGGIGSGKTTVSNMFADLGVPVIDADVIAQSLLQPGTPATQQVIDALGPDIKDSESGIDRSRLRKLVFNDQDKRRTLESILHPLVHDEILHQSSILNAPYCIIVIPLLFEAGHQDLVDQILVIDTSKALRIERASSRDKVLATDIENIINAQMSGQKRLALADNIIRNNGSLDQLKTEVLKLDKKYRTLSNYQTRSN